MDELLYSKILGEGKPLLILHGYLGMGDNWKSHANTFSQNFQVHLIDQRNHGRSFHSDDFDYELLVEDLLYYINHYKLGKVYLLGHSMGGKTAMLFAVRHPKKIEKLIVVDIAPRYYPLHHHQILQALQKIDFSQITSREQIDSILKKDIKEQGVRQFLLKNVYRKKNLSFAFRFNLESLVHNSGEIGEPLPSFTCFNGRTLFFKGEHSDYIHNDDEPLIKAHFPNSDIQTIADAGHWLHAENAKEFSDKTLDFLK